MNIKAIGAYSATQPLEPMDITRREPGPHDVKIEIAYCGVCHSDIHQVRSEWAGTVYPCVPGHEIVGRVVAVGDQVEKHATGDLVGVAGAPTSVMVPSRFSKVVKSSRLCGAATVFKMKSKLFR